MAPNMTAPLHVLVTGGAGFIGAHLTDGLLAAGHAVRVLDNLDPQAHEGGHPQNVSPEAEFVHADFRDREAVATALDGIDAVFHQGGMVGNGQSMYELHRYIDVNGGGTAILLEEILRRRDRVQRLVVASSMVVYGEGSYTCPEHGVVAPNLRDEASLAAHRWEPLCPRCAGPVDPAATAEDAPLKPTSTYAVSKRDCEELCLITGRAHRIPVVALRYLNTYGPRQALSNPYTGVAAVFSTQLLNGRRPVIYEDGAQLRDLTHITDVVRANLLALTSVAAVGHAINVGTGASISVRQLAATLAHDLGVDLEPEVTGAYRAGVIRHCWADVTLAERLLGFRAEADRAACLRELAGWVAEQRPVDRTGAATAELRSRGLIR